MDDPLARILALKREVEVLQRRIDALRNMHNQFVTVVAVAAGGEIRLTKADYKAAFGYGLYIGHEDATGTYVYQAIKQEADPTVPSLTDLRNQKLRGRAGHDS